MAQKDTKETKIKDDKALAADKENEQGEENVGEFGDRQIEEMTKEKKPRKEFQVLDLGNEDNVSDWLGGCGILPSTTWNGRATSLTAPFPTGWKEPPKNVKWPWQSKNPEKKRKKPRASLWPTRTAR